jgi:two-component sensor histidine kinase
VIDTRMRLGNLLRWLPSKPQPAMVRYGATLALVGIFFIIRLGAASTAGPYDFIIFIPAILVVSIAFDRASGLFATVLSALLVATLIDWKLDGARPFVAMTLFVLVSAFVALVGEAMRDALEREVATQQQLDLLLQEQGHRIKNDLAIASSLITLQARSQTDLTVRRALEDAVVRLQVLAESHDHLRMNKGNHLIDLREYLCALCWRIGEAFRGLRPIAIQVTVDPIVAPAQTATSVGLIVNELVTNALKYAFPDDRAGIISVTLKRSPGEMTLVIQDDGIGCMEPTDELSGGLGSRLVRSLVQQLGGQMTREAAGGGCRVMIIYPRPETPLDGTSPQIAQRPDHLKTPSSGPLRQRRP